MFISIGITLLGLILLVIGGEFVVRGASNLARSFGVSQLVVGLTVVAFGTSAPELGVSLLASIKGNADIAVTNVVGSNIFNTAFILGLCALISPLVVHLQLLKIDIPIFIFASVLTYLFSFNGKINYWEGGILLTMIISYTFWLVRAGRTESKKAQVTEAEQIKKGYFKERLISCLLVCGGILTLVYGSRYLVEGATDLALRMGISESIIGLTLVAAGTSMPELVSSVMATIRGKTDIAIGNVIGSGIFNLLFILGGSTLFAPDGLIISKSIITFDFPIMIGLAVLSYPLLITAKRLVRWEGLLLLTSYIIYTALLFLRN